MDCGQEYVMLVERCKILARIHDKRIKIHSILPATNDVEENKSC